VDARIRMQDAEKIDGNFSIEAPNNAAKQLRTSSGPGSLNPVRGISSDGGFGVLAATDFLSVRIC